MDVANGIDANAFRRCGYAADRQVRRFMTGCAATIFGFAIRPAAKAALNPLAQRVRRPAEKAEPFTRGRQHTVARAGHGKRPKHQ
jgi:hypothetical protein